MSHPVLKSYKICIECNKRMCRKQKSISEIQQCAFFFRGKKTFTYWKLFPAPNRIPLTTACCIDLPNTTCPPFVQNLKSLFICIMSACIRHTINSTNGPIRIALQYWIDLHFQHEIQRIINCWWMNGF